MKISLQYLQTEKIKVLAFTVFKLQNLEGEGFSYVGKVIIYHEPFKWWKVIPARAHTRVLFFSKFVDSHLTNLIGPAWLEMEWIEWLKLSAVSKCCWNDSVLVSRPVFSKGDVLYHDLYHMLTKIYEMHWFVYLHSSVKCPLPFCLHLKFTWNGIVATGLLLL
jgi:hypothetical protein